MRFLLDVCASVEFLHKMRGLQCEDSCRDPVVHGGMVFLDLLAPNVVVEGGEGFFDKSQRSRFNAEATHIRTRLRSTRPKLFLPDPKQGCT